MVSELFNKGVTHFGGMVVEPLQKGDVILKFPGCQPLNGVGRLELQMVDGVLQKS